ncbi:MAG: hypothetical protein ABS955_05905, partial [Stenotrophomonas maltophilia]
SLEAHVAPSMALMVPPTHPHHPSHGWLVRMERSRSWLDRVPSLAARGDRAAPSEGVYNGDADGRRAHPDTTLTNASRCLHDARATMGM